MLKTLPSFTMLTPEQAAARIGVAPSTLGIWRSTGRYNLPFVKAGSRVRYRAADVELALGLLIDVIDQGPGVEPALQERLFERGARGRTPGSSHGLGLYIVRRVMELHGGQAQLLSTGPQGTTMRLVVADAPDE